MSDYKTARHEVARFINIAPEAINHILYEKRVEKLYTVFEIPKKNGKTRVIHTPDEKLKLIQRKLGEKLNIIHGAYIKKKQIKSTISHGFEKNKSIITNAYRHRNKKYLLNIDISDFLSSFNFGRVQGYFQKSREFNFSKEASTVIAQLVCYNGKLPQGAPTSPIISNLIFNIVDLRILFLARKYKLIYTRYVDDLSFSTNNKAFEKEYLEFIKELTELLGRNGFDINQNKTRLTYFSSRQEVTGLTVNEKVNVNRKFINETRAMANQLYKTHSFQIDGQDGFIDQLEGRLAYINQLDWFNNKKEYERTGKKSNKRYISGLNTREKQYQYFLFYKYFFRPIKPTIVTEGKTDILHIKAALMKYSDRYPKLISKSEDGEYKFKINFLNKTKRLEYFLGVSRDGADTMKNIWNFYTGQHGCKNIFSYISKKCLSSSVSKVNPVILLFDNEQKSDRPLKKFLNHIRINLNEKEISVPVKENLFLQTVPLINGLEECEIEDLYNQEVLDVNIGGKFFNRKYIEDSEEYFGKYIFSTYIIKHYKEINFNNFIAVLDSINDIICKTE